MGLIELHNYPGYATIQQDFHFLLGAIVKKSMWLHHI